MLPESVRRMLFFVIAGGVGFLIYYVLSNFLYYVLSVPEVPSALSSMIVSIFPTYYLQRRFTFRSDVSARGSLPKYLALQAVNAVVIGVATHLCKSLNAPQAVNFAIAGFMGVGVSFFVQKKFIFKGR